MSLVHVHLVINHVPLLASVFGLLLLAWGLIRKSPEVQRAGLATFVVAALLAGATFLTGEPAEEAVEGLPGVSEAVIEQHEDAASFALGSMVVLGLVSLAGLLFDRWALARRWLVAAALLVSLVAVGLVGRTANLGGQIRHSEIRAGAAAAGDIGTAGEAAGQQGEHSGQEEEEDD